MINIQIDIEGDNQIDVFHKIAILSEILSPIRIQGHCTELDIYLLAELDYQKSIIKIIGEYNEVMEIMPVRILEFKNENYQNGFTLISEIDFHPKNTFGELDIETFKLSLQQIFKNRDTLQQKKTYSKNHKK